MKTLTEIETEIIPKNCNWNLNGLFQLTEIETETEIKPETLITLVGARGKNI